MGLVGKKKGFYEREREERGERGSQMTEIRDTHMLHCHRSFKNKISMVLT